MIGADGPRKFFKFELSRFAKTSSKFLDISLERFCKKEYHIKEHFFL